MQLKLKKKSTEPSKLAAKTGGGKGSVSNITGKTLSETYVSKEWRQWIYDDPDTYAGSIDPETEEMWVLNQAENRIERKKVTHIEAFYKIFDEVLVNAIDHHHRLAAKAESNPVLRQVKEIKVELDRETGWITVYNDGDGIDVAKNDQGIWIPQMLFAEELTSSNYDKSEKRTVGGKNGVGAKVTNVLSSEFKVETVDAYRKLLYKQSYHRNLNVVDEPEVEKYTKVPYTKVSYLPDYQRFGIAPEDIAGMDMWEILERRVYDASACTGKKCAVSLNGKRIPVKTFEDYVNMYIGNKRDTKRVYFSPNPRWEVVICLSPEGEHEQVSFVNGINTDLGGRHVKHVVDNLSKKLAAKLNEKSKKGSAQINPAVVTKNVWAFVKSTIENPKFKGQTKRFMSSLVSDFGSRCELTDDFVDSVIKLGIDKRAKDLADFKARAQLDKDTDGKRTKRVYNAKLTKAPAAPSHKAILVLTEGDSAAKFFSSGIKGLDHEERKYWGCFPLKGKLLNVQTATLQQLQNNEEIKNIKQILGLNSNEKYEKASDIKKLRYGKIMILTDADADGDHIKGLVMNFIYSNWPNLFNHLVVSSFATPIVKVWPKQYGEDPPVNQMKVFYSLKAHKEWSDQHPTGWLHQYYKGLGTHTPEEACECFRIKMITHYFRGDDKIDVDGINHNESDYSLKLAFLKKFEDKRKEWQINYLAHEQEEPAFDVAQEKVADFINKRMILYSIADNIRSIPNLCDGLKPSQRKIIYTFFKKRYASKIKVAQFGGAVMEVSAYHHGEKSIYDTTVGLANDYVGAGNLNLLHPSGQYGSRKGGGSNNKIGADSAASRYLFVAKTPYLELLFNKTDNLLLTAMEDDGKLVEPEYYMPTMPLVLINGAEGIGTGWSTSIPCYNPEDIYFNLKRYLEGKPLEEMIPFYRGYEGKIEKIADQKYITVGNWERISDDTIRITELPVGHKNCKSFIRYKEFLNGLIDGVTQKTRKRKKADSGDGDDDDKSSKSVFGDDNSKPIESYDVLAETDTNMTVEIKFQSGLLDQQLDNNENFRFEKKLKIAHAFSTTNMHLFDAKKQIKKYDTPEQILEEYAKLRLLYYQKRIDYDIAELEHAIKIARLRYRFILDVMKEPDEEGQIDLRRKEDKEVESLLANAEPPYPKLTSKYHDDQSGADYEYLLSIRIDRQTKKKLAELKKKYEKYEEELEQLRQLKPGDLWSSDLDHFIKLYRDEQVKWRKRNKLDDQIKLKKPKTTRQRKVTTSKTKPLPTGTKISLSNKSTSKAKPKALKLKLKS